MKETFLRCEKCMVSERIKMLKLKDGLWYCLDHYDDAKPERPKKNKKRDRILDADILE